MTLAEWIALFGLVSIPLALIAIYQTKKSIKRSSISYKKEIAPHLVVTYEITQTLGFDDRRLFYRLHNRSAGHAKILSVKSSGHLRPEVEFSGKEILKHNGYKDFVSSPNPMVYHVELLEQRRNMPTFLNELQADLHRVAAQTFFIVMYQDQEKNSFRVMLSYNGENGSYTGSPIEE